MLQVITVNQVIDILVQVQKDNDWKAALQEVLPGRKIVEPADTSAAAAAAKVGDQPGEAAGAGDENAGQPDKTAAEAEAEAEQQEPEEAAKMNALLENQSAGLACEAEQL